MSKGSIRLLIVDYADTFNFIYAVCQIYMYMYAYTSQSPSWITNINKQLLLNAIGHASKQGLSTM